MSPEDLLNEHVTLLLQPPLTDQLSWGSPQTSKIDTIRLRPTRGPEPSLRVYTRRHRHDVGTITPTTPTKINVIEIRPQTPHPRNECETKTVIVRRNYYDVRSLKQESQELSCTIDDEPVTPTTITDYKVGTVVVGRSRYRCELPTVTPGFLHLYVHDNSGVLSTSDHSRLESYIVVRQ